ncbi:MAG: hypothetical protein IJY82_07405 [Oscillospiraceae bacterium]|nr:hypothetical protein [Oscillospiraceae bacterium]
MKHSTMKKWKACLCAGLSVLTLLGATACTPAAQPEGDEPWIGNWVQWYGGQEREDGTKSLWDWQQAEVGHVNQMSTYYLATDDEGNTVYGVPTNAQYQKVMDHALYDIEKCDERGIRIIGYSDTVQFEERIAQEMGFTLDQIASVNAQGQYTFTNAWHDPGLYIACINSPEWKGWLKENLRQTAAAGFAGLQYDFHPYAGAGLFCYCEHCKEGWKEHSKEVLGEEAAYPTQLDFSNEVSREYWRWKIECFRDFMDETSAAAKEINPDFLMLMNNNANGVNFAFEALYGAVDMPTSEHGGTNNGFDSTLYLYQMAEALGFSDLYTQYNAYAEVDPAFRYKVNIGESFATTGGITYVIEHAANISTKAFTFADERHQVYANTKSMAKAAVLWSIESNLFSMSPEEFPYSSLLYTVETDYARQVALLLVNACITYDYLALEPEGVLERMDQYDVFFLPEYSYFEDETWKPVLEKIKEQGKDLIVLGTEAESKVKELVPELADYKRAWYIENFTKQAFGSNHGVPKDFMTALNRSKARDLVSVKNNQAFTSVTVREGLDGTIYLHVVRRGGDDALADHTAKIEFTLPEGYDCKKITGSCPFTEDVDIDVDFEEEDGVLTIQTGDFDTYALLTLKK